MFEIRSLRFTHDQQHSFDFPDITLKAEENLLVLGESGIGKTTLLHLMAGLLKPSTGTIKLLDTDLTALSASQLDRFRGQHIGMVFQRPHFLNTLSIQQHLELIQHLAGKKKDLNRIQEVANSLQIENKLTRKPHQLSQGEQQRAAVALAVINSPKLILADEPTASLDDNNCTKVADLLQKQAKATEALLIIITHDQRLKTRFQNQLALT